MDLADILDSSNQHAPIEKLPWMKKKNFILVDWTKPDGLAILKQAMDACIASKLYALDIECTGLDNRVFNGKTVKDIVGICLSPDGVTGYYIPLRHIQRIESTGATNLLPCNVPLPEFETEFVRLLDSPAVAIFHNGKFDQEFLTFNGRDRPWGDWDLPGKWEDTLILAYLENSRARRFGLKPLADTILGQKMIELKDLFPLKYKGPLDFSLLNPSDDDAVVWYGASDAVCTYQLYEHFLPLVVTCEDSQSTIYKIEKSCVGATRWMERNRVYVDKAKVAELIQIGQKECFESMQEVYRLASEIIGRDITPLHFYLVEREFQKTNPTFSIDKGGNMALIEALKDARAECNNKVRIATDSFLYEKSRRLPITKKKKDGGERTYPAEYDIMSPQQFGLMLEELEVPGLAYTEKSGQVQTSADVLDEILTKAAGKLPWVAKVIRFRETQKALSTFLLPLWNDTCPVDDTVRIGFNGLKTDTGRFSTSKPKNPTEDGGTSYFMQGTPATYDPNRPACMTRIRECFTPRKKDSFIVAIDFSGEELRIVTNLSREPKWLSEFFHCAGCNRMFDRDVPPPRYCPDCGSDKIGDLHTLTALGIYGADAQKGDDWKALRGYGKCLHLDTLIVRDGVLQTLGTLPTGPEDTFMPLLGVVRGETGPVPLVEVYNGGLQDLFYIVTNRGIVACTERHTFKVGDGTLQSLAGDLDVAWVIQTAGIPTLIDAPYQRISAHEMAAFHDPDHETSYLAGAYQGDANGGALDRVEMPMAGLIGVLPFLRGNKSRVPAFVLSAGREAMLHYMAGLWDIMGEVSDTDGVGRWATFDIGFASQVATVASALGMEPWVEVEWETTLTRLKFRVTLPADTMWQIGPYMRYPVNAARLQDSRERHPRGPNRILGIYPAGKHPCLDLHVDDPSHLYWANGLVSHNSTNFALCYGGGGHAVCAATGVDENEGWRIKRTFDATYKGLQDWWKRTQDFGRKTGYVKTAFGRHYPVPDIQLPKFGKDAKGAPRNNMAFIAKAERNAVNGPVQSSGADIVKLAMTMIHRHCKKKGWLDKARMIITMHDELVFDMDADIMEDAIQDFTHLMTNNPLIGKLGWPIPLLVDVDVGHDWTVPWSLTEIAHTGKWPEELKPWFPKMVAAQEPKVLTIEPPSKELPPQGGDLPPQEGLPVAPESTPISVVVQDVPSDKGLGFELSDKIDETSKPVPEKKSSSTSGKKKGAFKFVIKQPLTLGTLERLAYVIARTHNKGNHILQLETPSGDVLSWTDGLPDDLKDVRVNPQLFELLAKEVGL